MQIQAQIRQNAEGISAALSEMSKWEKQIKVKDKTILESTSTRGKAPVRSGAGTVMTKSANADQAAKYTKQHTSSDMLTPSTIVHNASKAVQLLNVPKARGINLNRDPEDAERERGNSEFQSGNFNAAVKSYTKCLGLKVCVSHSEQLQLTLSCPHRAGTILPSRIERWRT